MNILKKSALGVSALLLFVTLFVFGLAFGLHRVFGAPGSIKSAINESGIYQSVVEDVLAKAQKEQPQDGGRNEIPVDMPDVQNVIKSAIPPSVLQSQAEKALDSIYAWVQGETPKLQFTIELDEVKKNLADELGKFVEERAAALPACDAGNVPASGDFDPFNATCLPPGVTPGQVSAQAKSEVLDGGAFKDTTITADNLMTENGKSIEDQLKSVPAAFQKITWAVYGAALLALLLAAAVVFLSVNWRSGIKKVSIIFIIVGVLTAAFSWVAGYGLSRASDFAKEPLQQSGIKVAESLANDVRGWWTWYGIALIAVGIVTLLVLAFTKKKLPAEEAKPAGPTGEYAIQKPSEQQAANKPEDKQKPKPVKKLVQ